MTEPTTQHAFRSTEEYVQRVTSFLTQAGGWCRDRGLTIQSDVVTLREDRIPEYEAPCLYISMDGVSLARILPVGSRIIGARGRVDLIGQIARHPLLFCVGKGLSASRQTVTGERRAISSSTSVLSGLEVDGWYWIESAVLRAKRVGENLFLDLLTDVSDYEF
jgi:hypothetical protein